MESAVLTGGILRSSAADSFSPESFTEGAQLQNWWSPSGPILPVTLGVRLTSIVNTYCRRLVATAAAQSMSPEIHFPLVINQMQVEGEDAEAMLSAKNPASIEIARIIELTALTRSEIADKLLGVHRQSLWYWETNRGIKPENIEKLTTVRDILERARAAQPSQTNASDLRWWLFAPRGESGMTPQQMIRNGEYAKARMLATAVMPEKTAAIPKWLEKRPANPVTANLERILNTYDNRDFLSNPPTSAAPEES